MKKADRGVVEYDVIVIGSGAGGSVTSHLLADAGKKVALIEEEKIGGECPNYGCVPTKAMLKSAALNREAKKADKYGIRVSGVTPNMAGIIRWVDRAVYRTGTHAGRQSFEKDGVDVITGRGHFLSPHEIAVGDMRYKAKKFVISTGSYGHVPPIEGLAESGFITYKQAIQLTKIPKSLCIVGAGAIGCEFAQIFSDLGTKVTLVEYAPRVIAAEDKEVGELVEAMFEQRGISVHTGAKVVRVSMAGSKKEVHFSETGHNASIKCDEIMIATGRHPNVDIGLENAKISYSGAGIMTNAQMQTSQKHIYAVGDVVGKYAFTHMATYQGRVTAHNILHKDKVDAMYHAVPRCVFLEPEVACVGLTEVDARKKGYKIRTAIVPTGILGRANTSDERTGFVKIITNTKGVIIGASIVSPRAGEVIHELALACNLGLKASDIESTIHAFPTWSEAVRIAAAQLS